MQKLKVIAYCRVSTEMQEKKESLETHIQAVKRFCIDNDYELLEIHKDVMSGGNRNRTGFQKAMRDVETKDFDIFLSYDVSRIARDVYAFLKIFNKLKERNIQLKLINNPNLNSDSPLGELILTILAAIFQYFRFDNSQRVRDGSATRVKETGRRMAGKAPYGYVMQNKNLVIDSEEAEEIRYMFSEILKGTTINQLALKLQWAVGTVRGRLRNPTYAGINKYGVRINNKHSFKAVKNENPDTIIERPGIWESIIPLSDFESVQDILENKKNRILKNVSYDKYLLSSLLKCECGGYFTGATSNKTRYYYRCKSCGINIKRDILEKSVIDELLNTDELKILDQKIKINLDRTREIKIKENELNKLEKRQKNLVENLLDQTITKEVYNEYNKLNDEKIELLRQEIKALNTTPQEKTPDISVFNTFKEILKNINEEDREDLKNILQKMIDRIIIKDRKIEEIKLRI
jgi:site-specific DNA recombinase